MKVKIFSVQLMNKPGYTHDPLMQRETVTETLQNNVNAFLKEHLDATVEWLQDSAACQYGSFTQLTAIIRYNG